ncbi:hypothetical protein QFZ54_003605 [Sphingomonas faeni]|jgi:hypothetical protein|nr:hypothetical protein [Sphingomonas faeni]
MAPRGSQQWSIFEATGFTLCLHCLHRKCGRAHFREYSTNVDTERVDHCSYARQGIEMEPAVKVGHASAAIEWRAEHE